MSFFVCWQLELVPLRLGCVRPQGEERIPLRETLFGRFCPMFASAVSCGVRLPFTEGLRRNVLEFLTQPLGFKQTAFRTAPALRPTDFVFFLFPKVV